jgi:tetratricopeptide (TPR) repeat protein
MIDQVKSKAGGLPKAVGRYRVTGRLGKGAMGIVYSAHDDQMDRDVAIKVMMADLEQEPETRARFYREARITSQLLHRNIITVFDFGQEEGRLYIVMELLKGATLADFLKSPEHQQLEQKLDLMVQTCEGLSAAHVRGVVHRDIKPGNLFVQKDGALKILDFGVARIASSSMTASGLILGTPDYMSPEQACGKPVDARSDIFSAAAVFYFMLTGRKPFDAPELPSVLQKVLHEDPPPIREHEAPGPLIRIILRAMEKDPARRYQRFADLASDLVRFKRHFETETRQIATSARERVELLGRLLADVDRARIALGLPAASGLNTAVRVVRERYPFLYSGTGEAAPMLVPLRRSQLAAILKDLEAVLGPIVKALERLRAVEAAVQRGEHEIEAGDANVSLTRLEAAAASLGEMSPRIERGVKTARSRIAERRAQAERAEQLLAECRTAERAGDWTTVAQRGEEVLALDPQSAAALALVSRARSEMAALEAIRTRRVADLLDQAARCVTDLRFDAADRLLDQAREIAPADGSIDAARVRATEARQAAEARQAEARAAREAIAQARSSFESDGERSIERLDAFAREHPGAADVAAALQRLRLEATARRRRLEAAALAEQADAAWNREEVAEALRHADLALGLDPSSDLAQRVQQRARARLKEQAEATARADQARTRVEQAKRLIGERKFDKAVRELHRALEIQPDCADAVAALEDVRRRQADEEAGRKRVDTAARSAEARAAVERALALLRAGKSDKAAREAQRALDLEPGQPDAVAALEQVQRHQAEAAAARKEAEAVQARARAMERELEAARAALRHRDFARAAQAAENALKVDAGRLTNEPTPAPPLSEPSSGTPTLAARLIAPLARLSRRVLFGGLEALRKR